MTPTEKKRQKDYEAEKRKWEAEARQLELQLLGKERNTMSHCYGVGAGSITETELQKRSKIAKDHGVSFTWMGEAACECGQQCEPFCCPRNRKWWFQWPEGGTEFDRKLEQLIEIDLEALRRGWSGE